MEVATTRTAVDLEDGAENAAEGSLAEQFFGGDVRVAKDESDAGAPEIGITIEGEFDFRTSRAIYLQVASGYRWSRWKSTSGWTKLHLRDGPHLGCGLWATHNRDLEHTMEGEFCKRCMAADPNALATERQRRRLTLVTRSAAAILSNLVEAVGRLRSNIAGTFAAACGAAADDMRRAAETERERFIANLQPWQRAAIIEPPTFEFAEGSGDLFVTDSMGCQRRIGNYFSDWLVGLSPLQRMRMVALCTPSRDFALTGAQLSQVRSSWPTALSESSSDE